MNRILASAATASPTRAIAVTEAEFGLIRSAVTSSRSWSPGTTGRRSLTSSIEASSATLPDRVAVAAIRMPAGLGHGLDDQDAGHDRPARPVSLEERLVDAHVLERHDATAGLELEHPVDQQERVAMRQDLHDPLDVHRAVLL